MVKSRESFVRLAESRTNKILKEIDVLSNLSNKTNYSYNEADIKKIFGAISRKLKECEKRFETIMRSDDNEKFKL